MNRQQARNLWAALSACTYKLGTHAPFDCVCVHDGTVYVTDGYIIHRVDGLFDERNAFTSMYGHACAYASNVRLLNKVLERPSAMKRFSVSQEGYKPERVQKALRAHRAIGANRVAFMPTGDVLRVSLIIKSETDGIVITTAVKGEIGE